METPVKGVHTDPIDFSSIHRILFIYIDSLGDILLTTPVLRALRTAFPNAFIAFLTAVPEARDLFRNNPDVDDFIVVESETDSPRVISRLPAFDLVFDLSCSAPTCFACLHSRARYRVGLTDEIWGGKIRTFNLNIAVGALEVGLQ